MDIEALKTIGLSVAAGLGTLIVAGTAYIQASKSKSDDEWLAKMEAKPFVGPILTFLKKFSVVKPLVSAEEVKEQIKKSDAA